MIAVATTNAIYEEARQTRLGADKFMIDGRTPAPVAATMSWSAARRPATAPFLRRPDLLKSLILHWQRHPSLSYLFSGMFIGPTSQAPRSSTKPGMTASMNWKSPWRQVPLPESGAAAPPWLVDRLFRNLLIDVTGNTTARKSASTSCSRRMDRLAASASSSSAASRCRRTHACRLPSNCWCAR